VLTPLAMNVNLRSSRAEFVLVTGGDVFFSRRVLAEAKKSLTARKLFRAQRVDIDQNFDFASAAPGDIEDQAPVLKVHSCTEPPWNKPPFTGAAGDFILMDRASFVGFRGFDETVRKYLLNLDTRFVMMPMELGFPVQLLGDIHHINHASSWANSGPSRPYDAYDFMADLPYLNGRHWGLGDFAWTRLNDRLMRISVSRESVKAPTPWAAINLGEPIAVPDPLAGLSPEDIGWAVDVRRRLAAIRAARQPSLPPAGVALQVERDPVSVGLKSELHWEGASTKHGDVVEVVTVAEPWGYSSAAVLDIPRSPDLWRWVALEVEIEAGGVGFSLQAGNDLIGENVLTPETGRQSIFIRADHTTNNLMIRNGGAIGQSRARIYAARLVSVPRVACKVCEEDAL
jgi:hypothetical protein